MDKEEVRRRVNRIKVNRLDSQTAHELEDELYEMVLEAIASGCTNAQELAKEALKSQDIDFVKYYS